MKRRAFFVLAFIILIAFSSYAHPGRTDGNGGHYNRSTGEYHYHHGYPEHQHPGGVCPYDKPNTETISKSSTNLSKTSIAIFDSDSLVSPATTAKSSDYSADYQKLKSKYNYLNSEYTKTIDDYNILVSRYNKLLLETKYAIVIPQKYWIGAFCSLPLLIILLYFYLHSSSNKKRKVDSSHSNHDQLLASAQELDDSKNSYSSLQKKYDAVCTDKYNISKELDALKVKDYKTLLNVLSLQKENGELQKQIRASNLEIERLKSLKGSTNSSQTTTYDQSITASKYESLKADYEKSLETINQLRNRIKTEYDYNYYDLMKRAGVPEGVSFDSHLLPHYYCNSSVERNMRVYISPKGKCYHRECGCSGALRPTHLFTVADQLKPCSRCIPKIAQNYRVPGWYHTYVYLLGEAAFGQPIHSLHLKQKTIGQKTVYKLDLNPSDGIKELK